MPGRHQRQRQRVLAGVRHHLRLEAGTGRRAFQRDQRVTAGRPADPALVRELGQPDAGPAEPVPGRDRDQDLLGEQVPPVQLAVRPSRHRGGELAHDRHVQPVGAEHAGALVRELLDPHQQLGSGGPQGAQHVGQQCPAGRRADADPQHAGGPVRHRRGIGLGGFELDQHPAAVGGEAPAGRGQPVAVGERQAQLPLQGGQLRRDVGGRHAECPRRRRRPPVLGDRQQDAESTHIEHGWEANRRRAGWGHSVPSELPETAASLLLLTLRECPAPLRPRIG